MGKQMQLRLKEVWEELSKMIPQYLEEVIIIQNFKKMDQEIMYKLGEEFSVPISDDFFYTFIPKMLEYLIKAQQQQRLISNITFPPLTLMDLINTSFFPTNLPILKRYPNLEKLVENLNYKIHKFFINQRPLLQCLIKEQLIIDLQNQDSFEQQLVKDIEQLKREKSIEKSQLKESSLQINQMKIEVSPNSLSCEDSDLLEMANYQEPKDDEMQCSKCFCYKKKEIVYSPIIRCIICQHLFHIKCLQLNDPKQVFICPFCIIAENDPLHEIVEEVLPPFIFRTGNVIPSIDLKVELKKNEHSNFTNKCGYELRCIKIDGRNEDIQWPAYGRLHVNGEQILQFQPLLENSSLKRRKDEAVQLSLRKDDLNIITLSEEQYVRSKNYRVTLGLDYVVALYKIKYLKPIELVEKVKAQQSNYMTIDQSKIMIKIDSMYHLEEGVEMEKIKVNLIDVYDCGLIQTPVRGSLCIHIQCFSLENICKLMSKIKSNTWRCPICKSIILNFKIDTYQLEILNIIRKNNFSEISEITFNTKGEIETPRLQEYLSNYNMEKQNMDQYSKTRQLCLEILSQKTLKLPYVFQDTSIQAIKKVKKKYKEIRVNIKSIKGTAKEPICID